MFKNVSILSKDTLVSMTARIRSGKLPNGPSSKLNIYITTKVFTAVISFPLIVIQAKVAFIIKYVGLQLVNPINNEFLKSLITSKSSFSLY